MKNMSIKELKQEILLCDYYMNRLQFNILGEILSNYGGRTTGHSQDMIYFQEYENRKKELTLELKKRKKDKASANIQLSSKRTTERTDRSLQRPTK